jgi:hypothetical protein
MLSIRSQSQWYIISVTIYLLLMSSGGNPETFTSVVRSATRVVGIGRRKIMTQESLRMHTALQCRASSMTTKSYSHFESGVRDPQRRRGSLLSVNRLTITTRFVSYLVHRPHSSILAPPGCSASLAAAAQPGNAAMLRNQKFESGMELERLVWGVVGASTSNRESTGNSTDRIAGNDAERAFADGVLPGQGQGPRQDKPEVVLNMAEPGAGTEVQTKASPVGHATFSNKKVEMLVRGMSYS